LAVVILTLAALHPSIALKVGAEALLLVGAVLVHAVTRRAYRRAAGAGVAVKVSVVDGVVADALGLWIWRRNGLKRAYRSMLLGCVRLRQEVAAQITVVCVLGKALVHAVEITLAAEDAGSHAVLIVARAARFDAGSVFVCSAALVSVGRVVWVDVVAGRTRCKTSTRASVAVVLEVFDGGLVQRVVHGGWFVTGARKSTPYLQPGMLECSVSL